MPFDEEDLDPHGECAAEIKKLRAEIEALRAALDAIGAMFYIDREGLTMFKPRFDSEAVLDAVNAALASVDLGKRMGMLK